MDMLIYTNDLFDNLIYLLVHRHDFLPKFLDIQMDKLLVINMSNLLVDGHDLLPKFLDIQMDMLLGQLWVVVLYVLQVLVNVAERPEFETYKYA